LTNSSSALGAYYRGLTAPPWRTKGHYCYSTQNSSNILPHVKNHTPYQDLGADYYEKRYKERVIMNMKKKA